MKQDPKGYAQKVKQDPKGFVNSQKEHFKGTADSNKEIEEARFADEGAADPSNNLRVVTEEELKIMAIKIISNSVYESRVKKL